MTTVAEQESVLRTDVAPGNPDWRSQVPVNNLRERIAAAQERVRQQNIARQSGVDTGEMYGAEGPHRESAVRIVRDLGLANQAASRAFINRMLVLEETVNSQAEIILALCSEIEALKRRKGYTPHAETR
jgi:hypothetical protein